MLNVMSFSKIRAAAILFTVVSQSAIAFAQDGALSNVNAALNKMGANQSAFCYAVENDRVQGINQDQPVKIASVMKLITSYWAIERLGSAEYRYKTKLYYSASKGEIHIEGTNDPFFHKDRLYLLLSNLNTAGVAGLNRVTADRNFRLGYSTVDVEFHTSELSRENSQNLLTGEKLLSAFNVQQWSSAMKSGYNAFRSQNPNMGLAPQLSFQVGSAEIVDSNPLAQVSDTQVLEVSSAPLRSYLKRMNIMSANPMADELFYSLGGIGAFRQFMSSNLGMNVLAPGIHSGSGLWVGNPRRDTEMPCSAVVAIIRKMDQDLRNKSGLDLSDIAMIAGLDLDDAPTYKGGGQTLVVKTGTINGGKNLAGSLSTTSGRVYFGIFMQGAFANEKSREKVVEAFLSSFNRTPITNRSSYRFQSVDGHMTLRSADTARVAVGY